MARQSKARLRVWLPKGAKSGPNTHPHVMDFEHSDAQTDMAKDIADGLRAKGYEVQCTIEKEVTEDY